jgi:hypothetical protein
MLPGDVEAVDYLVLFSPFLEQYEKLISIALEGLLPKGHTLL